MINRELIKGYLQKDSPGFLLAERSTPINLEEIFSSEEALVPALFKSFGEKAYTSFVMDNGLILQNGSLVRAGEGKFGLYFNPKDPNTGIETFRLLVYLYFAMSSKEVKPVGLPATYIPVEWLSQCKLKATPFQVTVAKEYGATPAFVDTMNKSKVEKAVGTLFGKKAENTLSRGEKFIKLADYVVSEFNAKLLLAPSDVGDEGVLLSNHPGVEVLDVAPLATASIDHKTMVTLIKLFASIFGIEGKSGKPYCVVNEAEDYCVVIVDNAAVYEFKGGRVYREGQVVQHMVVHHNGKPCYYHGYGAFLFTLMAQLPLLKKCLDTNGHQRLGTWESRYLRSMMPIDNEALAGAEEHGMRPLYTYGVAQSYSCESETSLAFLGIPMTPERLTSSVSVKPLRLQRKKHPYWHRPVLFNYNLFYSDKSGVYVDNRLLCFKADSLETSLVEHIMLKGSGAASFDAAVKKIFKFEISKEEIPAVLKLLSKKLIVLETKKYQKAVTRTQLQRPTACHMLVGGEQSAIVESILIESGGTRCVVHKEPCMVAMRTTSTAGTTIRVAPMPYGLPLTTIHDVIEKFQKGKSEITLHGGETEEVVHPDGTIWRMFTSSNPYVINTGFSVKLLADYAGYDNNGVFNPKLPLKGFQVAKDEVILDISYTLNANDEVQWHRVLAPEALYVLGIKYFVNQYGGLDYTVLAVDPMNVYKMRDVHKSMPAPVLTGKAYIYNSLNRHLTDYRTYALPEGVNQIITQDCIKFGDLMKGDLPFVATTAEKNGYGSKLEDINLSLGYPEIKDGLVYDKLAASVGVYDELREWFWRRYGQSFWTYKRDIGSGAWDIVRMGLKVRAKYGDGYWVKSTVAELERLGIVPTGRFPSKALVIHSDYSRQSKITKYDDIFVIYLDKHQNIPLAVWQRSYGAGPIINEEGGVEQVWGQQKFELSDMKVNVSEAKLMAGVVNNVAMDNGVSQACPEYAMDLMGDYKERIDRYAIFMALANNLPLFRGGKLMPILSAFEGEQLNSELAQMLLADEECVENFTKDTMNLKHLAKVFKDVVIDLGEVKLFLPVIADQDPLGVSTDTVSGLVRTLLTDLMNGAKRSEVKGRIARLGGAIKKIVGIDGYSDSIEGGEGLNLQRQMTQGRNSALAKLVAIEGLPYKAIVPFSQVKGSAYQVQLKLLKKAGYTEKEWWNTDLWVTKPTDPRVIVHRSPLTSQAPVPIVPIREGQYWIEFPDENVKVDLYWILVNFSMPEDNSPLPPGNVFVFFSQSAMILVQMGDCDGDGINHTVVDRKYSPDILPSLTAKDCRRSIKLATSKEAWALDQGSYTMDQMLPKKIDIEAITAPRATDAKNFRLLDGVLARNDKGEIIVAPSKEGWDGIQENSDKAKGWDVGGAYGITNQMCFALGVGAPYALIYDGGLPRWMTIMGLIKPSQELYEAGPLSGLNWDARYYMDILKDAMRGKEINVNQFKAALDGAGVNVNYWREYLQFADTHYSTIKMIDTVIKNGGINRVYGLDLQAEDFVMTASLLMFWATKGQLQFYKEENQKAAQRKLGMAIAYLQSSVDKETLAEFSPVIRWLNYALPQLLRCESYGNKYNILNQLGLEGVVDIDEKSFKL